MVKCVTIIGKYTPPQAIAIWSAKHIDTTMKDFKQWLLQEMPISKFQLMGQWEPGAKRAYGYNRQDVGILTNPAAVEKIHRHWSNSKNEFDFYFLRSSKARRHVEVGQVSPEWVKENLEIDIQPREDAITIIFTQNTGAEKIPMTAWTIAHRLGHAIRRDRIFEEYLSKEVTKDFRELLREVYGIDKRGGYGSGGGYGGGFSQADEGELRALAHAVGTMRSARQGNLRNFFEFIYELVAQYIITGGIKFNPIPKSLLLRKRMAWGRPAHKTSRSKLDDMAHDEWDEILRGYADKYEHYLDSVFSGLEGKIFVM